MEDQVLLVDSLFCRLCAEENENGTSLFTISENDSYLSTTINKYLPVKVKEDGKLPKTICPGCNIQLEAMVQFMELIISGQRKLREMLQIQNELQKNKELLGASLFKPDLESFMIQAVEEDGKEILIQIMPDGSLYSTDHELSLRVEGLEKPRRKRGRPPKPPPGVSEIEDKPEPSVPQLEEGVVETVDADGRKRRRRKVPSRFLEAVQGKELERIFREEGVIEGETGSEEDEGADQSKGSGQSEGLEDEVIGHLENVEGQDLGEVVVVSKGTGNRTRRIKSKRKKNYQCDICNRGFMHLGTYLLHKSYHRDARFECLGCNELFTARESLAQHQTDTGHVGEGVVEGLGEGPRSAVETEEDSGNRFSCALCDKQFSSKQSVEVHVKAIHEGKRPYSCDRCDRTFAYQASLKQHAATHHDTEVGEKDGSVSGAPYSCELCGKRFNHPSSVVYHKEAEHSGGRRFVCNKCGKAFKHKQLLQRHQLVHTDERPHACDTCGATFKTRANLLNHAATHTGVKRHTCRQCGQPFAHKTSLTLHMRWHAGHKPYACDRCGKAFSQKGNLQEHQRIHTGEKPYACAVCSRRFTTSSQHRLHVKRHTGERPYACDRCDKAFLHRDTWKCHVRRHRDERPYRCGACHRSFAEQHALRKHLRLHTGERPYSCDACGKTFADCSNLAKHKKVHVARAIAAVQAAVSQTDSCETTADQLLYVAYRTTGDEILPSTDTTNAQTLVRILEDEDVVDETATEMTEIANGQLQVQDEHGDPIYYTTPAGQRLQVSSIDGHSLHVTTDCGDVIPVQLSVEDGRPVAVAVKDDMISSPQPPESPPHSPKETAADDVANLLTQSMHFITEDGQNVCFVLEPDHMATNYLSIA